MSEKNKTDPSSNSPSVWELLPTQTQERIHAAAVELAKSVPDLEHYKRSIKETIRENNLLPFGQPDALHKILQEKLPLDMEQTLEKKFQWAPSIESALTLEQKLAFEEAKSIQAGKDQPPATMKAERGILAIDDRNGATCVNEGIVTPLNIELITALRGKGTLYECEPVGNQPGYIVDLKKDPEAAKHVYTPPATPAGNVQAPRTREI
jgi:hypothetical protein